MKNVITVIALYMVMNTSLHAEPEYTLVPIENSVQCSNTDVAIGVGTGIVSGIVIGVSAIAASPVLGAAGVVGWAGAVSAPVITGSTLGAVAAASTIMGPIIGTAGYYASCVTRNIVQK
jgi:hypothetical protein